MQREPSSGLPGWSGPGEPIRRFTLHEACTYNPLLFAAMNPIIREFNTSPSLELVQNLI